MDYEDVLRIAKKLGHKPTTIYSWKKRGVPDHVKIQLLAYSDKNNLGFRAEDFVIPD